MLRINQFKISIIFLIFFLFLGIQQVSADVILLSYPNEIIQGEPILVQASGTKSSNIRKLTFDNTKVNIFEYKNQPSALLGIDLNKKPGEYQIYLELKDGSFAQKTITIMERQKYTTSMPVPESVGGNSPENQTKVMNILANENAILAVIKTGVKAFWSKKFIYPISNPIVTDPYGYSRDTGNYTIAHKGVDFKADEGTKVVAMNRGVVRVVRNFSEYGKTIVVDHGFGVMTFYMHLSKIKVNVGELVQQGQLIGLSGKTGYSTGPHLHITVRINNISIDPIKFLDLFR